MGILVQASGKVKLSESPDGALFRQNFTTLSLSWLKKFKGKFPAILPGRWLGANKVISRKIEGA